LKSVPVQVPYLKKNIREFISILDPLINEAGNIESDEMIQILRESLNYDKFIADDDIPTPDDSKIMNINQFQLVAAKYPDIPQLLCFTDSFQDASANDQAGISLMTVHKSKGLEFPVVFVIGMVDGVLPNKNGDIEEERRIAFVALSRAMQQLYLTYSQTYSGRSIKKSQFLDEILGIMN
jgi:DNA helicase II / ATP-dependent DNA helicase PcrA